jgi:hypothetical protein
MIYSIFGSEEIRVILLGEESVLFLKLLEGGHLREIEDAKEVLYKHSPSPLYENLILPNLWLDGQSVTLIIQSSLSSLSEHHVVFQKH